MGNPTSVPRTSARPGKGRAASRPAAGLDVPVLTLPGLPELETSFEDQAQEMGSRYQAIIANVEQIVRAKLGALPRSYRYHCLEHTEQVVSNVLAIAAAERLPKAELPPLVIAAWLHDYMVNEIYVGHEAAACEFAATLLSPHSQMGCALTARELEMVQSSIMATKLPQRAPHPLAEILADADLLYLGTNVFPAWSGRLRVEHAEVLGHAYTELEWLDYNIQFVMHHQYFTSFAREYYGAGVSGNLQRLEEMRIALLK